MPQSIFEMQLGLVTAMISRHFAQVPFAHSKYKWCTNRSKPGKKMATTKLRDLQKKQFILEEEIANTKAMQEYDHY